jgi:hypothetical protein
MTILNAWVGEDKALVGVDTEMLGPDGARHSVSKLLPLPHMNAVVACRGPNLMLSMAMTLCHASTADFDVIAAAMPGILHVAHGMMLKAVNESPVLWSGDPRQLDGVTIVFVGWSPSRRRMVGFEYEQETPAVGFVAGELSPLHSAPWDPTLPQDPDLSTRQGMAEYAKLQTDLLHRETPGASAGGRFIVAELSRFAMVMGTQCYLPKRKAPRLAMNGVALH